MKIARNLTKYTLAGFFSALIGLLLMSVLTHYLSARDYGILSLFNSYVIILMPFIGVSASGLISIEFYNKNLSRKEFSSLFSSVSMIPILIFIFSTIPILVFRSELSSLLDVPHDFIILIALVALLSIFFEQALSYLVIDSQANIFSLSKVLRSVLEASFSLILIIWIGYNWTGRVYGLVLTLIAAFFFYLLYFYKKGLISINIKWRYIRAGIIFGAPLILHIVGKFVINQSDKIFIAKMISVDEVGVYNTSYIIGGATLIIVGALSNVYTPYLFERLTDLDYKKKLEIVQFGYLFIAILSFVVLAITILSPFIYRTLIGSNFSGGEKYVSWIALSYFFWGIYLLFAGFIFYEKRTRLLALVAVVGIVLNVIFNYLLISRFGTIGAAYATALSYFILMSFVLMVVQIKYRLPWFRFKSLIEITIS